MRTRTLVGWEMGIATGVFFAFMLSLIDAARPQPAPLYQHGVMWVVLALIGAILGHLAELYGWIDLPVVEEESTSPSTQKEHSLWELEVQWRRPA